MLILPFVRVRVPFGSISRAVPTPAPAAFARLSGPHPHAAPAGAAFRSACMRATIFLLLALAGPLAAQRDDVPRRPPLPAAADSNDAGAYFRLGQGLLDRHPRHAADAFYWAAQIQPGWAEPLYGRHVALLMAEPRRLVQYMEGDPRTHRSPEGMRIDSLYLQALRADPFVQHRFDRELIRLWVEQALVRELGLQSRDLPVAAFYSEAILRELPPRLRGRVLAGEGRLPEALRAYDAALRERRRGESLRELRHERARMFALVHNDSMAMVELGHAIEAHVDEEESGGELVGFYRNKALLEHSLGLIHERRGDLPLAAEAYARALVEDLSYYPAHRRMGLVALTLGDTATAVQELALAAEAGREDPTVLMAYGALLSRVGRAEEAEALLARATELAPYYAEPWLVLGVLREWRRAPGAVDAYRGFLAHARRDDPRREQVEPLVAAAAPAP